MAWSIFKDGGGKPAAQAWAQDLLQGIGAPATTGNIQVIYDWEVSEGGGGAYNPLNQGPVPGHPELTTTGSQYGGGAADYASFQAGLQGAVSYLNMQSFASIKKSLVAGDSAAARAAIIASPWASSHYGNGATFSTEPLPGQSTALPGITNANFVTDLPGSIVGSVTGGVLDTVLNMLGVKDVKDLAERAGLMFMGVVLMTIGLIRITGTEERAKLVGKTASSFISKGAVGGSENAKPKPSPTESV